MHSPSRGRRYLFVLEVQVAPRCCKHISCVNGKPFKEANHYQHLRTICCSSSSFRILDSRLYLQAASRLCLLNALETNPVPDVLCPAPVHGPLSACPELLRGVHLSPGEGMVNVTPAGRALRLSCSAERCWASFSCKNYFYTLPEV